MNTDDKNRNTEMRKKRIEYQKIARELGLDENTMKTYCCRNGSSKIVWKEPEHRNIKDYIISPFKLTVSNCWIYL